MITLNLLPEVKKDFIRAQRARTRTIAIAIIATIAVVVATVLLALYVYGGQALIINAQTEDIKKKSKELQDQKDIDKYLTIQNQLANVSALHENKNHLSRLLDYLKVVNPAPPNNMRLDSLEVSVESGTVTMRGSIADYAALAVLKDTLSNVELTYSENEQLVKEKLFTDVLESGSYEASGEQKGVSFTIIATYTEKAFSGSIKSPVASVKAAETTQSVVQAPSVFGGQDGQ